MGPMLLHDRESLDTILSRLDDDGNPLRPDELGAAHEDRTSGIVPPIPGLASSAVHENQPDEGNPEPPTLYLTLTTERRASEVFNLNSAAPAFRGRFNRLYPTWRHFNATYFAGRLAVPHISIGLTTPRRFSECRLTTDYGGEINIVLSGRVVFGTDRRVVRTDDPDAEGVQRFVSDLLLGETVKQFVLEILGDEEDGWGGRGPLFCREANRIGEVLGLPRVEPRRRAYRGMGHPVAAFWPWALRPPGYYLEHVRLDHLQVAGLRPQARFTRHAAVPGIYEYFLYLLVTGQTARLTDLLGRMVDAEKEARSPALAAAESGPRDATGMPLPLPLIDPAWLTWNGGCVREIAEGIRQRRAFDGMPILADALQDAGCENDLILVHCRAHADHTANCWVLRLLTEPAQT